MNPEKPNLEFSPELSILMPVYNELENIGTILDKSLPKKELCQLHYEPARGLDFRSTAQQFENAVANAKLDRTGPACNSAGN